MQEEQSTPRKPLRLWPGVLAVVLQWLFVFGLPIIDPGQGGIAVIGGAVGTLVVLIWWLFFSRAAWPERLGALALIIVAVAATSRLVHESIGNGMMGMMLFIYAAPPVLSLALVSWAAASRGLSSGRRLASLSAAVLLACATLTLVRTNGISGSAVPDLRWRWTQTAEQRLLARGGDESRPPNQPVEAARVPALAVAPAATPDEPVLLRASDKPAALAPDPAPATKGADWPGFRGSDRDGVVHGGRIDTDWSRSPPVQLWRRPIGPGWSSFAVRGDLLYTQEQRGDEEIVSSYSLTTGKPVWMHRDATRFWESNGGAGPRATPTLSDGRVYTFGATGILNALDARDGSLVWSRNAATDTGAKLPGWGFASSPLVVGDVVVVHAGVLAAYDRRTGERRWTAAPHGGGYSSPQLFTIDGVEQILLMSGDGAASVAPADGRLLWEHAWPSTPIVQPALTADGDVLITSTDGTRRLAVAHASAGWTVEERWTSNGLKPYFNDFVVHEGHAFGFDGSILACIDLSDGKRKWKGGRYGNGQLVLLPDQDLLLVLSEEGELALVRAGTDQFTEIARFPAIEGKTWNHPALVGDVLLVRNGEEMAAFRLSAASR